MTSDFESVPQRRASDGILPKADLSDPALHTAKELRRNLRILIGLTLVIYIVVLGVAGYTFILGQKNTRALCTIRNNAQDRIDQTVDFLRAHPNGISGISVADLRRSIDSSRATVRALDDVNCPAPPP